MWGVAHKVIFRRGATFRAILHYSRRTVALASAALPAARRAGKHGARRGADGARPARRGVGPPRLRLVAAHALPRPQPARGRRLPRADARRARHRRRPASYGRTGAPAPSRDHLQRDRALRRQRGALLTEYGRINALLVQRARRRSAFPSSSPRRRRARAAPSAAPCFAEPARGELTLRGRKLVGSAQWRDRRRDAAARLDPRGRRPVVDRRRCCASPRRRRRRPRRCVTRWGAHPSWPRWATRSFAPCARSSIRTPLPLEIDDDLAHDADRLAERYRDDAWTWRR